MNPAGRPSFWHRQHHSVLLRAMGLVIAVACLLLAIAFHDSRSMLEEQLRDSEIETANHIRLIAQVNFDEEIKALRVLGQILKTDKALIDAAARDSNGDAALRDLMDQRRVTMELAIFEFIGLDGAVRYRSLAPGRKQGLDVDWGVAEALRGQDTVVMRTGAGGAAIRKYVALSRNGKVMGALGLGLVLDAHFIKKIANQTRSMIALFDRDGLQASSEPDAGIYSAVTPEQLAEVLREKRPLFTHDENARITRVLLPYTPLQEAMVLAVDLDASPDYARLLASLLRLQWHFALIAVLGSLAMGLYFYFSIVRPILALRRRSGELLRSLFGATHLNASGNEITDLNISVSLLSDRLVGYAHELEAERDRANASSQAKTRFLANISHEIRTPLNGVLGMSELLAATTLDTRQRRLVHGLSTSGENLLTLVNDILDQSRIESGKFALENIDFEIFPWLQQLISNYSALAAAKNLDLAWRIDAGVPLALRGDPGRLRQIAGNLLSNAIKFTGQGSVTLGVSLDGEDERGARLRIEVTDTGIGISAASLERVFQPFEQADASTTREYGGTGLGLAIARDLARLMGGDLVGESTLGAGSRFTLTGTFLVSGGGHWRDLAALHGVAARRALVWVEREALRETLAHALSGWGIAVEQASSVEGARAKLKSPSADFDLLVFDAAKIAKLNGLFAGNLANAPIVAVEEFAPGNTTSRPIPAMSMDALRALAARMRSLPRFFTLQDLLEVLKVPEPPRGAALGATPWVKMPPDNAALAGTARAGASMIEPPQVSVSRASVLLVDDVSMNRDVACSMLEMLGCEVWMAENGEQAVEITARKHFDVVLMDCMMPVMDGYEATSLIRRRELAAAGGKGGGPAKSPMAWRQIIVALTANAMEGDQDRCLMAGMDEFLAKPFRARELALLVERYRGRGAAAGDAGVAGAPVAPRRPVCLVVDDDHELKMLLNRALVEDGWEVELTGNGEEALAALEERVPDLVLTDLYMPRMDGHALLESMKRDARWRRLPVVVLTSIDDEDAHARLLKNGAQAIVVKPVEKRVIVERLRVYRESAAIAPAMAAP